MAEQVINSDQALNAYIDHLKAQWEKHHYLRVDLKTGKQRSATQNRCLHLYCTMVADMLNDGGLDMQMVLSEGTSIPWSMPKVKEDIWGKVQLAMTGKVSTTNPTTKEYGEIYEVVNRHLSQTFGVFVPWPTEKTKKDRE